MGNGIQIKGVVNLCEVDVPDAQVSVFLDLRFCKETEEFSGLLYSSAVFSFAWDGRTVPLCRHAHIVTESRTEGSSWRRLHLPRSRGFCSEPHRMPFAGCERSAAEE